MAAGSLATEPLTFHYPASDRLMKVQWARDGHVGLDVPEAGFLKRSIRRSIESVGLAVQPLKLKCLEVDVDRPANAG